MAHIRKGTPEDINALHALICELAEFERALPEVTNTPEQLLKDGFGENPLYGFYVAELEARVVGIALYYYRYSTWKGKVLYLEDIYIQPAHRGQGIGEAFIKVLETHAQTEQCARLQLQVLDWNEPAVRFYEKMGMSIDKEWWNVYKTI
ncbi:MAG: GNAT family N-acetyltransferase [Bacteroidetes bacterium]|nr:MAG: GNAT family N-acetyltransferase [Bacteroidota bacterium]